MNLAIDTATPWGRFAVADRTHPLAYLPSNVTGSYADAVLPVIERLLQEAETSLDAVSAISVTRGPGSFTGVRIGVATAKSLAWALNVPLMSVTSLEAMAAALLHDQIDRKLAVPVLDARRGELFAAVYRRAGGWVEALAEPVAMSPHNWWQRVLEVVPDLEAPVWGGDGVSQLVGQGRQLRPELRERGLPTLRRWVSAYPATARAMAVAMGDPSVTLPEVHPFALVPLYLRASDAEVKRGLDLTPTRPDDDITIQTGSARAEDGERRTRARADRSRPEDEQGDARGGNGPKGQT